VSGRVAGVIEHAHTRALADAAVALETTQGVDAGGQAGQGDPPDGAAPRHREPEEAHDPARTAASRGAPIVAGVSVRLKGRRRSAQRVIDRLAAWAPGRPDVRAIAVVGSYAYGRPRVGSDLDVVVLSDAPSSLLVDDRWVVAVLGNARPLQRADWGAVVERRFRLPCGLQVELNVGRPSWASIAPVDDGTRRVVTDGCVAVHDPDALLARLLAAVTATGR